MANPLSDYSTSIEGSLLAGNATEYTHRPALKTLIEALVAGAKAINEPAYRSRYAEFLKGDFPRVPIPSDRALFWRLAALGRELVALHLLDADVAPALLRPVTCFPVAGDGLVEKGHPRYDEANQRLYISADNVKAGKQGQYVEGVPPEVWRFQVGGYQPCQKWLKDRAGRKLTYDDLTHYQRIVVALKETIRLMAEIDGTIPAWPIR